MFFFEFTPLEENRLTISQTRGLPTDQCRSQTGLKNSGLRAAIALLETNTTWLLAPNPTGY